MDLAAGRGDACSLDRKRSVDTAPSCDAVSGRRPATASLGAGEMQCTTVTQQGDETAMSGMARALVVSSEVWPKYRCGNAVQQPINAARRS